MKALLSLLIVSVALAGVASAGAPTTVQEDCTTGAGEEVGTAAGRVAMTCVNLDTANPVYFGYSSGVTSSTGQRVAAGDSYTFSTIAEGVPVAGHPIFCRATGGTVTISCDQSYR